MYNYYYKILWFCCFSVLSELIYKMMLTLFAMFLGAMWLS